MDEAFQHIRQFLKAETGVALGREKNYLIQSRLAALFPRFGFADLKALAAGLLGQPAPALVSAVISSLTTHETSWFRDARLFERLKSEVLPAIRQQDRRDLSIWSAACATGQEIYSLAMLLAEEHITSPVWQVFMLASDICEHVLDYAGRGLYSQLEIGRGLPANYKQTYVHHRDTHWEISERLRERIRFEQINLIRLPPDQPRFDIIFCRNVLIYFDRETQRHVLEALHDRLNPGGFLFLGAAESPLGLTDRFSAFQQGSGIYRRLD